MNGFRELVKVVVRYLWKILIMRTVVFSLTIGNRNFSCEDNTQVPAILVSCFVIHAYILQLIWVSNINLLSVSFSAMLILPNDLLPLSNKCS